MARSWVIRLILGIGVFLVSIFFLALPSLAADFPQPVGHVNDFAEMLSSDFRQSLEQDLIDFENETTAEIAVVTINSLEGNSLEDYAVRLFEDWKIGKKEKDNGILILIAKEDRKIRIEVGYGLEPIVTDARAGRIIRDQISPAFRNENYDGGVKQAVEQIKEYIRSGQPPAGLEKTQEKAKNILPLLIFLTLIFIYIASFWGRTKAFWPGGVIGGIFGAILGAIIGTILSFVLLTIFIGLFGLLLDWILSSNYQQRKKTKKPTGFFSSWGGFSSGGGRGGGFGGFGGGSSGGGGASGGW